MAIQDLVALAAVAAAVLFASRVVWRQLRGVHGCHCAQARGKQSHAPSVERVDSGPRRYPLVTVDMIGKPYPEAGQRPLAYPQRAGVASDAQNDRRSRATSCL